MRRFYELFSVLSCTALAMCSGPASAALGDVDPGFHVSVNGIVRLITVQPDGRILVVGDFTEVNGTARFGFARLHADGTLDTNFQPPEWPSGRPSSLALAADGSIWIGKGFGRVVHLHADGSIASFGPSIVEDVEEEDPDYRPSVHHVLVQPDGKVLFVGYFTEVNGFPRTGVARLNADGSLDQQFNPRIRYSEGTSPPWHIDLQPDGKVLLGGDFWEIDGQPRSDWARLNADGTVDTTFSRTAEEFESSEYFVALPDGKILMTGCQRLNEDGTLDNGFVSEITWAEPIVRQFDGKLLTASGPTLARLNENGSRDTNFNATVTGSPFFPRIQALAVQPDGKVLIGGDFNQVNGTPRQYLARLLAQLAHEVSVSAPTLKAGVPGFDISSLTPRAVVIEASIDLIHWVAIATNTVNGDPTRFSDPNHSAHPSRFYRVNWRP